MIEPLRVLLGLSPAPTPRTTCGGASLELTPEAQRSMASGGIAFAATVDNGQGSALCRVRCDESVERGVALCQRCAHLERSLRDERRREAGR